MGSIAQHHCGECNRTPDEARFRMNGSDRLRKYCEECSRKRHKRLRDAPEKETTALVPSRVDHVNVNGCDVPAVFVNEWQRYWPVKPAVEATGISWSAQYERMRRDRRLAQGIREIRIPSAGGPQDTICLPWDAWHYFWTGVTDEVNDAARPAVERIKDEAYAALAMVFGDGPKVLTAPAIDVTTALEQVRTGIVALFGPTIEQLVIGAIRREKGTTPDEDREVLENTRVVREGVGGVLIKEVPGPAIVDEWMSTGSTYLAVERRKGIMSVGKVIGEKTPQMRMKDSDYNGDKSGDNRWEVVWSFQTDKPGGNKKDPGAELVLIAYIARMGIEQLTDGGRFRYDARVEADFKRLPPKLKFANLHRWIEQAGLFPELMFVYACQP